MWTVCDWSEETTEMTINVDETQSIIQKWDHQNIRNRPKNKSLTERTEKK